MCIACPPQKVSVCKLDSAVLSTMREKLKEADAKEREEYELDKKKKQNAESEGLSLVEERSMPVQTNFAEEGTGNEDSIEYIGSAQKLGNSEDEDVAPQKKDQ